MSNFSFYFFKPLRSFFQFLTENTAPISSYVLSPCQVLLAREHSASGNSTIKAFS